MSGWRLPQRRCSPANSAMSPVTNCPWSKTRLRFRLAWLVLDLVLTPPADATPKTRTAIQASRPRGAASWALSEAVTFPGGPRCNRLTRPAPMQW